MYRRTKLPFESDELTSSSWSSRLLLLFNVFT